MGRLGRMTDAGRAVLPDMSEKGFVIDGTILEALQADKEIKQPELCIGNRMTICGFETGG